MDLAVTECIGCGYCCWKAPCGAALERHPNWKPPCPELLWDEVAQRHWCSVVLNNEVTKDALFIGAGCSSSLFNDFRTDLKPRTEKRR